MVESPKPDAAVPRDTKPANAPKTIESQTLLDGGREVWIVHQGERYRLCLTRRNKLILQK
ncbi:MAG: hemin uptake protein HemP [Gemmataceae bacterium]|nr:hemin uptake protein HemP [Gemmataceae bacterium]